MSTLFRVRAWDWEGWITITVLPADEDEDSDSDALTTLNSVIASALSTAPRLQAQVMVEGEWEELE